MQQQFDEHDSLEHIWQQTRCIQTTPWLYQRQAEHVAANKIQTWWVIRFVFVYAPYGVFFNLRSLSAFYVLTRVSCGENVGKGWERNASETHKLPHVPGFGWRLRSSRQSRLGNRGVNITDSWSADSGEDLTWTVWFATVLIHTHTIS